MGFCGRSVERRERRRGRVRLWIVLLFVLGGSIWALERLGHEVEAAEFTTVDMRRTRLVPPRGSFCDARWESDLAAVLARFPAPEVHDTAALLALAREVAKLPFVAETGEARVVWPDGVRVPIRLREPVACVKAGEGYLCVSEDAILLPGIWPEPPVANGRQLPVIGPNDGVFDRLVPGTRLHEPRHLDALSVAISMRRNLPQADAQTLGPILIDATKARATSVEEPGTLLELEGPRLVLFGRAPWSGQPGELPAELKWRSLSKAAALLRGEEQKPPADWSVLDVRWDTPALRLREESTKPKPAPVH